MKINIKILIFLKVFFLGWYILHATGLKWNENPLMGQDKKTPDPETKQTSDENASTKTRKSFLSDLLELPPINTESMKKDEMVEYITIVERKKRQLDERLTLLKEKDEQLKKLENSLEIKIKKLDEERLFFSQTIQKEKDLKGERLDQLLTFYLKMEPKKAAPFFEKMDKDLAVELFKKLPQKVVTTVMENMSPEKAVFLSEYFGRVRSAREYDVLKEMNMSLRKEFDECKGMPQKSNL